MRTGIYGYPGTSRITYGIDFCRAAADEVELVGARRVLLLASGTLAKPTWFSGCGARLAHTWSPSAPPSPRTPRVTTWWRRPGWPAK